ncbi:MAG: DUF3488 and transglutaminase-like domain-containing protein [Planctomycetota bacterium]
MAAADYQIPRKALFMLLAATLAAVGPFAWHLALWIPLLALFCVFWRGMVGEGRWHHPPTWLKAVLVAAAAVAVAVESRGRFSVEAASGLLIIAFALKLVEMKSRRDACLVVFLGYFVIATAFLFSQSLFLAVYQLVAIALVTAGLIGLNQRHNDVRPFASLRLAGALLAQALPLTLILFLFFPRIAPLWNVPIPAGGTSGISESVTPGDIANLSQSDEIALRAVFTGEPPSPAQMYWRGVVYEDYDRGTWTQARDRGAVLPLPIEEIPQPTAGFSYTVFQEPSLAKFLFGLETAFPIDAEEQKLRRDFTLRANQPLMSVMRYDLISDPGYVRGPLAGASTPRQGTSALPNNDNPRVVEWAQREFAAAGSADAFVERILREIRGRYVYTLSPPTLPRVNAVDTFWFETRAGFCSHFAGAFVYMMRAAGIPARMVGGYQGGEINPLTRHVVVRQYDAHAWAEVWTADDGWRRVDPTAAIAPERIRSGLRAALSPEERAELSALTNARLGFGAAESVLQWLDSVEHRWNLWVVGYDSDSQFELLSEWFGERPTTWQVGVVVFVGGILTMLVTAIALYLRRRPRRADPLLRAFDALRAAAARRGMRAEPWESPMAFVRRVGNRTDYATAELERLIQRIECLLYAGPAVVSGQPLSSSTMPSSDRQQHSALPASAGARGDNRERPERLRSEALRGLRALRMRTLFAAR